MMDYFRPARGHLFLGKRLFLSSGPQNAPVVCVRKTAWAKSVKTQFKKKMGEHDLVDVSQEHPPSGKIFSEAWILLLKV